MVPYNGAHARKCKIYLTLSVQIPCKGTLGLIIVYALYVGWVKPNKLLIAEAY